MTNEDIDKFYYDSQMSINPVTATFYNDYRFEDLYVHPCTGYYRNSLKDFIKIYRQHYKNSAQPEIMLYNINLIKEYLELPMQYLPINHFNNPFKNIIDIIDRAEFNQPDAKREAFSRFKKRMFALINTLPELLQLLQIGITKGIVENKKVIELLITDLENLKDNSENIKNFKKEYKAFIKDVVSPEAKKFAKEIKLNYLKHCKSDLGLYGFPCDKNVPEESRLGIKIYNYLLKAHLSIDISHKEILELGLGLVKKYDIIIKDLQKEIKNNNVVVKCFKNKNEVLSIYKKALKELEIDSKEIVGFPKNYKTTKIIPMNEEFLPAALFYTNGFSKDSTGIFKINIRKPQELMYHDVRNLVIHEAVPGHSLQLQYTMLSKNIPKWLRISENTSVCEGWALYVERFIKNPDPLEKLSTANSMQIRAVRLVIDTMMHVYGIDFEICYKYMHKYLYNSKTEITSEIYRYSVLPGQATAYMIGCISIEKMADNFIKKCQQNECKVVYGPKSKEDLKKFHTEFLKNSYMPLCFIEKKLI